MRPHQHEHSGTDSRTHPQPPPSHTQDPLLNKQGPLPPHPLRVGQSLALLPSRTRRTISHDFDTQMDPMSLPRPGPYRKQPPKSPPSPLISHRAEAAAVGIPPSPYSILPPSPPILRSRFVEGETPHTAQIADTAQPILNTSLPPPPLHRQYDNPRLLQIIQYIILEL